MFLRTSNEKLPGKQTFSEWRAPWNNPTSGDQRPADLLDYCDVELLNYRLLCFATEVQKQGGLSYQLRVLLLHADAMLLYQLLIIFIVLKVLQWIGLLRSGRSVNISTQK